MHSGSMATEMNAKIFQLIKILKLRKTKCSLSLILFNGL